MPGAEVLYISKGDSPRRRLRQYARFGTGEPASLWGGRLIWQLAGADQLLIAWHALSGSGSARDAERRLLARFAEVYDGRRPFANLAG